MHKEPVLRISRIARQEGLLHPLRIKAKCQIGAGEKSRVSREMHAKAGHKCFAKIVPCAGGKLKRRQLIGEKRYIAAGQNLFPGIDTGDCIKETQA